LTLITDNYAKKVDMIFRLMSMVAVAYMVANAACASGAQDVRLSLWNDFVNSPDAVKPWSYFARCQALP
jgi:hypothetical protein